MSHKTALSSSCLFGLDPNREINLITPKSFKMASVIVPIREIDRCLEKVSRHDRDRASFDKNFILTPAPIFQELQVYLRQIFYLFHVKPRLLYQCHDLIRDDLIPLLLHCFSRQSSANRLISQCRRATIVELAEAYMAEHLDQPLTLVSICHAINTSKSALNYGFQDIFMMSPMAYLKILRLNGARRLLTTSEWSSTTVLSVANRFGFWHMGHFSMAYRQMFGEMPSTTLQRPASYPVLGAQSGSR